MCETFEGWSNRETWCANLWIENEPSLYGMVKEYTRQEVEDRNEGEEISPYRLGEVIRDYMENEVLSYSNVRGDEQVFTILTDIGSLYRVSWKEIANYLLDQYAEEVNA